MRRRTVRYRDGASFARYLRAPTRRERIRDMIYTVWNRALDRIVPTEGRGDDR